jgi:hypothetical protein
VLFTGRAILEPQQNGVAAGLLHTSPTLGSTAAERFYALSRLNSANNASSDSSSGITWQTSSWALEGVGKFCALAQRLFGTWRQVCPNEHRTT